VARPALPVNSIRIAILLLVCFMLAGCGEPQRNVSPRKAIQSSTQPSKEGSGSLVYLRPSYLPKGFERSRVTITNRPLTKTTMGRAAVLVIGKPSGEERYSGVVSISIREASEDRETGESDELEDVNGVMARVVDSPVIGSNVDWFDDGLAIALKGKSGQRGLVLEVARALDIPSSGDPHEVEISRLPESYVVISEEDLTAPAPGSPGDVERSLFMTYDSREPPGTLLIMISFVPEYPLSLVGRTPGTELRWVEVRKTRAVVGSSVANIGGRDLTQVSVSWLETPDVTGSVLGNDSDEMLRVVEGLEEVSEQEWRNEMKPVEQR
jgi:hypothetical protein